MQPTFSCEIYTYIFDICRAGMIVVTLCPIGFGFPGYPTRKYAIRLEETAQPVPMVKKTSPTWQTNPTLHFFSNPRSKSKAKLRNRFVRGYRAGIKASRATHCLFMMLSGNKSISGRAVHQDMDLMDVAIVQQRNLASG